MVHRLNLLRVWQIIYKGKKTGSYMHNVRLSIWSWIGPRPPERPKGDCKETESYEVGLCQKLATAKAEALETTCKEK